MKGTTTRSPTLQILDSAADLDDLTHIFVAEDIAWLHGRNVAIIQMQIGAADRRCRDLDDGITRVEDFWIGHRGDPHIVLAVPAEGFHHLSPCPKGVPTADLLSSPSRPLP